MAEGLQTSLPRGEARPARGVPSGRALLRALRPKQWAKNVLVLAAPAAAGVLTKADTPFHVGLAFVAAPPQDAMSNAVPRLVMSVRMGSSVIGLYFFIRAWLPRG